MTKVKGVKGFDKDLKCRDFQYEIGKTYECEGKIEPCNNGFHSIPEDESPLNVFGYYPPVDEDGTPNRFCEVECDGVVEKRENKIASSKLTVGLEIGIPGLVNGHIEWVKKNLKGDSKAFSNKDSSAATNTGDSSAATNTGFRSAATNTGNCSAAEVSGKDSVAIACGKDCNARASLGSAIVVVERGEWNGETYPLINIKSAIIDGVVLKADTWYTLKNGEFVEC